MVLVRRVTRSALRAVLRRAMAATLVHKRIAEDQAARAVAATVELTDGGGAEEGEGAVGSGVDGDGGRSHDHWASAEREGSDSGPAASSVDRHPHARGRLSDRERRSIAERARAAVALSRVKVRIRDRPRFQYLFFSQLLHVVRTAFQHTLTDECNRIGKTPLHQACDPPTRAFTQEHAVRRGRSVGVGWGLGPLTASSRSPLRAAHRTL